MERCGQGAQAGQAGDEGGAESLRSAVLPRRPVLRIEGNTMLQGLERGPAHAPLQFLAPRGGRSRRGCMRASRAYKPGLHPRACLRAGVAGGVAYEAYSALQRGAPAVLHVALGLASAAMAAFLVYNLLAGGNPPPKEAAAQGAAGAAA